VTSALLAVLACSVLAADAGSADAGPTPDRADAGSTALAERQPLVRVQPGTAKPGDAVLITVYGAATAPTGTLGAWPLHFLPFHLGYQALIGLPTDIKLAPLKVALAFTAQGKKETYALSLDVVEPNFRHDELKVAGKFVSPSKAEKKWAAEDQKAFDEAFHQGFVARLFELPFSWPKVARLSAPFGDLRLFNGKKQSQHFGADIDGDIGDSAFAANDGVVAMTRECFGSGNTVIIHHGEGLYTAYFHLSRIDVKKGDPIKQGAQVGLVGKTGRVTGPHLHWGVKIDGRWVDPQSVLRLDFE
jgi:murein DD-endopeptidase MepM/ murein hydrolase activator NlpD